MKGNHSLTVIIEMKDAAGRVVGRKEVATYHGLLAKAHDEGLRRIDTAIVQIPTKDNGETAIVRAVVETQKGLFTGIGDANPTNVNRRIAAHLIRMAETRAKARALRDSVNIGVVALEELGELLDDGASYDGHMTSSSNGDGPNRRPPARVDTPEAPPTAPQPFPVRGDFQPMTDNQRRLLFRLTTQRGVKPEDCKAWLEKEIGVESLKSVSRADASRAIDKLQAKSNGTPAGEVA